MNWIGLKWIENWLIHQFINAGSTSDKETQDTCQEWNRKSQTGKFGLCIYEQDKIETKFKWIFFFGESWFCCERNVRKRMRFSQIQSIIHNSERKTRKKTNHGKIGKNWIEVNSWIVMNTVQFIWIELRTRIAKLMFLFAKRSGYILADFY